MKYIASWSGGKDSTASIILAHEHNEPLDLIIFSEVMFDENISGELPEHIDFIKNKAIPVFESWGYEVKILHAKLNYTQLKHLRTHNRDLWDKLLELENEPDLIGNMWNTLTKTRIHDWEERFYWEERQMSIFDYLKED